MSQRKVRIIKKEKPTAEVHAIIQPDRAAELLKTIGHLESQAGRLVKMARDIRAEVLSLTSK